jgi:hypothetical protein
MRPDFQRFAQPKATTAVVTVSVLAAIGRLLASENLTSTEITLGEAKALVATVKSVAHEFHSKREHGLSLDPPVSERCPYFLFRAWVEYPGSASNLLGWYRVNKRNADVWEDPPYDEQPIDEPALAGEQAWLRQKHHIGEALVKQSRKLESWGPDCIKPSH